MNETLTASYNVPEVNLETLKDAITKIARRSKRLGLPEVVLTVDEKGYEDRPFFRWYGSDKTPIALKPEAVEKYEKSDAGCVFYRRYFPVMLTGQKPRLAGWEFVATLQHLEVDGEVANLLRIVPGHDETLPVRFRTATPETCEHCNKMIRTRKETFVVRHEESGEYKQVGRNCTQDFLGGKDPHAVIKGLEYLQQALAACGAAEEGMGFGGGGGIVERHLIENFLAVVAACVRVDGWMSRSKARHTEGASATADAALYFLTPPWRATPEAVAAWEKFRAEHVITDEDKETAALAIAYAQEDLTEKKEENDYLYNLWVAVNQPSVDNKLAGIVASLIPHYLREVERRVIREMEAKQVGNSQHVGAVGDRLTMTVTILRNIASADGSYSIIKMVDENGNALVWFGSGGMEVGKTYRVKATVKRHSEFKGLKETAVNRVETYTEEEFQKLMEKAEKKAARAAKKLAKEQKANPALMEAFDVLLKM